ncbi:MAG: oligosaccharide flippase family protein [Candidatus Omnitrophica bacterium]|nr:oligosaccharide flippase family protein [Candidatus Omnitrophota bacterium]
MINKSILTKKIFDFYHRTQGKSIGAFFIRKASTAFFMNGVVTLVGLMTQIVLVRTLGSEQYGDYIYVFSWITILSLIANVGMNNTIIKHIATYRAQGKWSEFHGIIRFANWIPMAVSIIISVIMAFSLWILRGYISQNLLYTFLCGCLLVPFYCLIQIRQSALRSMMFIVRSCLPEKIIKPILLIMLVLLLFLLAPNYLNAPLAMILDGITIILAFLLGMVWLHKLLPKEVWDATPKYCTREWLDVALPFLLISSIMIIMNKVNIIMIGFYMGTEQAGFFAIASRITVFITFSLQAVNTIFAPMISELYSTGKLVELQRITYIAAWGIFAFSVPVAIIFIVFGEFLLSIFGKNYTIAYIPLVILAIGQIVNALSGSVGFIMNMTGHHHKTTQIFAFGLFFNIMLNMILIPYSGLNGAAFVSMITIMYWNVAMCLWVYKHLNINTTIFKRNWA